MKVGLASLGLCLAATAALATDMAVPELDLAPHRAVYAMQLASTRPGTGVTSVGGYMTYKFGDSCDGWTVENKTALTVAYSDGAPVSSTTEFVTWESKDGLHYRFRLRSLSDGVVKDEISGTANLDGPGQGGTARYTQPEEKTLTLPKGTLFPTEHTLRLIENARHGEHLMERVLFDGTETDESFNVNAIIGKPLVAGTRPAVVNAAVDRHLLTQQSWQMHLAFFPQESSESTPDYEVGLRYYENGVSDQMVQSYGNYAIRATLEKLERLPKPDC